MTAKSKALQVPVFPSLERYYACLILFELGLLDGPPTDTGKESCHHLGCDIRRGLLGNIITIIFIKGHIVTIIFTLTTIFVHILFFESIGDPVDENEVGVLIRREGTSIDGCIEEQSTEVESMGGEIHCLSLYVGMCEERTLNWTLRAAKHKVGVVHHLGPHMQ